MKAQVIQRMGAEEEQKQDKSCIYRAATIVSEYNRFWHVKMPEACENVRHDSINFEPSSAKYAVK